LESAGRSQVKGAAFPLRVGRRPSNLVTTSGKFFATDCQELAIFPEAENASISFIDAVCRAISPQKEEG
jgi:hypothetical protein